MGDVFQVFGRVFGQLVAVMLHLVSAETMTLASPSLSIWYTIAHFYLDQFWMGQVGIEHVKITLGSNNTYILLMFIRVRNTWPMYKIIDAYLCVCSYCTVSYRFVLHVLL